jgi:hypothetical protein
VEHNNFLDSGRENFIIPPRDRPQVHVASRTAGVSAKLQMDQPLAVGNPNQISMDCHHFEGANGVA